MEMAQKTKTRFSSYNVIGGLSRVFRALGWLVFWGGLGYSIPNFGSDYSYRLQRDWYTAEQALRYSLINTLSFVVSGLTLAACAFLLSVILDTGLMMLTQRRTQIALLERLVRERREKLDPETAIVLIETL
jgi:hypothetical protein